MASDDLFRIRIPVRFPAPRVPDAEEFDAEGTAGELAGGLDDLNRSAAEHAELAAERAIARLRHGGPQ